MESKYLVLIHHFVIKIFVPFNAQEARIAKLNQLANPELGEVIPVSYVESINTH